MAADGSQPDIRQQSSAWPTGRQSPVKYGVWTGGLVIRVWTGPCVPKGRPKRGPSP